MGQLCRKERCLQLVEAGVAVIDLSADFRLKDPAVYEQWYQVKHTAIDLLAEAAFGLPELFRSELEALAGKRAQGRGVLVGCAGCYPTAQQCLFSQCRYHGGFRHSLSADAGACHRHGTGLDSLGRDR